MRFNPCSGGSIALGVDYVAYEALSGNGFQSLFWWKYCPGLVTAVNRTTRFRFNPCSGGSIALGSCLRRCAVTPNRVSILVLVEVLPWARSFSALPTAPLCFNPCSGGSIALGLTKCRTLTRCYGFNPCSGGSIALGVGQRLLLFCCTAFQSLFWWKYCPGLPCSRLPPQVGQEFQSLFWWKYCPGKDALWHGKNCV